MSRSVSERGRLGVGIGGDSLADEPPMLACLALPGKPVNSAGHHHRKPRKSRKADPYINTLVHVFERFSPTSVRIIAISGHGYSHERENARATSVIGSIDSTLSELSGGHYTRRKDSGSIVVEISEKDAMRYARCSERINNSGMLGIVIRLEELDDS